MITYRDRDVALISAGIVLGFIDYGPVGDFIMLAVCITMISVGIEGIRKTKKEAAQ